MFPILAIDDLSLFFGEKDNSLTEKAVTRTFVWAMWASPLILMCPGVVDVEPKLQFIRTKIGLSLIHI